MTSKQTLFNFLILVKSRFPPKKVLYHQLLVQSKRVKHHLLPLSDHQFLLGRTVRHVLRPQNFFFDVYLVMVVTRFDAIPCSRSVKILNCHWDFLLANNYLLWLTIMTLQLYSTEFSWWLKTYSFKNHNFYWNHTTYSNITKSKILSEKISNFFHLK